MYIEASPALNTKNHLSSPPRQTTVRAYGGRFKTVGDNNITTAYNAFDFLSFPPSASHFECMPRVVIYTTIASRLAFRSRIINKYIKYIYRRVVLALLRKNQFHSV